MISASSSSVTPYSLQRLLFTKQGSLTRLLLAAPAASASARPFAFALLVVQPLGDLLGVALVVQFQQPTEDFTPGGFADREAEALLRLVETVPQVEVGPAVGIGNGSVHPDVEFSEFLNVGVGFVGLV